MAPSAAHHRIDYDLDIGNVADTVIVEVAVRRSLPQRFFDDELDVGDIGAPVLIHIAGTESLPLRGGSASHDQEQ